MYAGAGTTKLIIDSGHRVTVRTVLPASSLPEGGQQGTAAEEAALRAAAVWSLPDFAYRSIVVPKGEASREVGDSLVVCGRDGLVVQVKSRVDATGRLDREANWTKKNVAKGCRQASGSIRYLAENKLRATNERGDELEINGPAIRWLSLVIIDHPNIPDVEINAPNDMEQPRVVLSRRDWEFLFDQLRSTHAVISYLWRVAEESDRLGHEPERYYDLAQADEEATPERLDPTIYGDGVQRSSGLLPMEPAEGSEAQHELMVRAVMESVATAEGITPEQRLVVLSELDQLQAGYRAELGAKLLENFMAVQKFKVPRCVLLTRTVRGPLPAPQMIFATATCLCANSMAAFQSNLSLKHHDFSAAHGHPEDFSTVGVMLTPRSDSDEGWETTAARLDGRLDDTYVNQLRAVAARPLSQISQDLVGLPRSRRRTQDGLPVDGRKAGRNEPCSCGSGLKYKRCCGTG